MLFIPRDVATRFPTFPIQTPRMALEFDGTVKPVGYPNELSRLLDFVSPKIDDKRESYLLYGTVGRNTAGVQTNRAKIDR